MFVAARPEAAKLEAEILEIAINVQVSQR